MRPRRTVTLGLVFALLTASLLAAPSAGAGPEDYVPRGDWRPNHWEGRNANDQCSTTAVTHSPPTLDFHHTREITLNVDPDIFLSKNAELYYTTDNGLTQNVEVAAKITPSAVVFDFTDTDLPSTGALQYGFLVEGEYLNACANWRYIVWPINPLGTSFRIPLQPRAGSDSDLPPTDVHTIQAVEYDVLDELLLARERQNTCVFVDIPNPNLFRTGKDEDSPFFGATTIRQERKDARTATQYLSARTTSDPAWAAGTLEFGVHFRIVNNQQTSTTPFRVDQLYSWRGESEALAHDYTFGLAPGQDTPEASNTHLLRYAWRNQGSGQLLYASPNLYSHNQRATPQAGGVVPGRTTQPFHARSGTATMSVGLRHNTVHEFYVRFDALSKATTPSPAQVAWATSNFDSQSNDWRLRVLTTRIVSLDPNVRFVC